MVGKDQTKGSRIFHQCYLKYCKAQNLTPLNALAPTGNGKILDFCVDRIKYQDWPPILNALSCDLSLHTVSLKCRQQVKTVLEHVDCERLAKTVNKRAVILTNFMLSNLVEAVSQLLSKSTLLTSLWLEGLPLKLLYLNPLCEGLQTNSSLEHISLSRCLIGDAGCQALCKTIRGLPNVITLDLSGCELTQVGAAAIADLIKYQKLHRYSENWVHTLRYRMPELDTMSGLRRITLCNNPQLGDQGVWTLLDVLTDDLWIKALDVQNCGLMENAASAVLQMLKSNTTIVILDMRHNADISSESLSAVRAQLRQNERGIEEKQFSWLSNTASTVDSRSMKSVPYKNIARERSMPITKTSQMKSYASRAKERSPEDLEKQLQEEIVHRKQLEELNLQLVEQMKQLKQQQIQLWSRTCNGTRSPSFEQSVEGSSRSGDLSSSSGSSSVPIDQNTLSYVQQAFKDIYAFIKNNQCNGSHETHLEDNEEPALQATRDVVETEDLQTKDLRVKIVPKKAQSAHMNMIDIKMNKTTKSAHMLRDSHLGNTMNMKPEMIERQMGDSKNAHGDENNYLEELIVAQTKTNKKNIFYDSPCSSKASESSDTLICSPPPSYLVPNPRDAFYSSTDEDSS